MAGVIPAGLVESEDLDGNRVLEPRERGQVKIISKGDSVSTSVLVDGHELTGVTSVTWSIDIRDAPLGAAIAKATLTLDDVAVEVDA